MKKNIFFILSVLIISCNSNDDDITSEPIDFTGIYTGTVERSNNYPPYGFRATIVDDKILEFKCTQPSGGVCFQGFLNITINNDGTFTMDNGIYVFTGKITSDFEISGTYLQYSNNFTGNFSGQLSG